MIQSHLILIRPILHFEPCFWAISKDFDISLFATLLQPYNWKGWGNVFLSLPFQNIVGECVPRPFIECLRSTIIMDSNVLAMVYQKLSLLVGHLLEKSPAPFSESEWERKLYILRPNHITILRQLWVFLVLEDQDEFPLAKTRTAEWHQL